MINAGKVKLLGNLFLKLEIKGKDGSVKKSIMLFVSYLIPGFFIPLLLYKQNFEATGFDYTFLTFLFFSLILSFMIVSELDNLIITKPESDLITSLPIDDKLIARAKLFLVVRYITVISLPFLVPGSLFYYFIMGSIPRTVLYFFSGLAFCIFLVNTLLLIYSFTIKSFKVKRLGTYTLILQAILIFLIIISYQFVSFAFTGRYGTSSLVSYQRLLHSEDFTKYFPQAWFAFIPISQNFIVDYRYLLKAVLPFFVTYMSMLSLRLYLIENYGKIREKFLQSRVLYANEYAADKGFITFDLSGRLIQKLYVRNHIERASFGMMRSHFRRDKAVRVNLIPMIIIPSALALFALFTDQLPSPFGIAYFGLNPVFHISIFLAVLIIINTAILGTQVTGNRDVSWVYDAYPLGSKKRFKNGIRKFFVIYLIIPVCIALFIIFSIKISFYKALTHTLFLFTFANLYNSLFHILNKTLPFTKENTLLQSLYRLGAIFYPLIFAAGCILLQMFVYQTIPLVLLTVAVTITVTFWLNFFAFVRHRD